MNAVRIPSPPKQMLVQKTSGASWNSTTLAAIAKLLEVSDRSLRRQLRKQGISFRGLLDEIRMQIALKYLRTTRLANEDIALALGFRRAFRRWTNKSPSEIRTR
jgi:transcriptional regulator GlxA family with amidase domain